MFIRNTNYKHNKQNVPQIPLSAWQSYQGHSYGGLGVIVFQKFILYAQF